MGIPIARRGARARRATRPSSSALALHGPRARPAAARASRSTWSSSGAAPTRASPTCAQAAQRASRAARWRAGVRALVVPGSQQVKKQAEAEGLDRVFREAGAEWREPGCSMCIAMNGDRLEPGQYAVSTSNRNFEGRQGAGGRTFLASPADRGRRRRDRPRSPTRGSCCDDGARFARSARAPSCLPMRQRRHRPDHPRALPEGHHAATGLGPAPLRRLALRRRRAARGRTSS